MEEWMVAKGGKECLSVQVPSWVLVAWRVARLTPLFLVDASKT